ncbi:MAG: histidine phosphatase family protein [Thiolinea sp.]
MATRTTLIDLLPSSDVEAGEVFCGSLDSPASTEGMKLLKKSVRRRNDWELVLTSPRACCKPFADWLAQKHKIPVQVNQAFREMDYGAWEGRLPSDIMVDDPVILPCWWNDPASLTPPQGESFKSFQHRVLGGWKRLVREQQGKTVLLVTHPGVVRLLLASVLNMPSSRFFSVQVESGSLTRLRVEHDGDATWTCLVAHGCQG